MGFKGSLRRLSLGVVLAFVFVGLSVSTASAHVTVKPGEANTSTYQVFTVNVPNEKDIPTTEVKIVIPENITNVTPTQKTDWTVSVEKEGDIIKSVSWQGGEIAKGLRDEFSFSAKTPDTQSTVKWKAYQTYSDGTIVAWDQEQSNESGHSEGSKTKGPLSVTSVIESKGGAAEDAEIAKAKANADIALYVSVAAVLLALISTYFATRRKGN